MSSTQTEKQALKSLVAIRERAKTDRMYLAREVLGYDFTEETHAELFASFPAFDETKSWAEQFPRRDSLILWSRGHYKTTAVMVVAIQAILVNPNIRIILMQGTKENTRGLLSEIAAHFTGVAQNSKLKNLFPEYCGTKQALQLTRDKFITPARTRHQLPQPTVTVASPESLKTGQHYDLGCFDDMINDQNYRNPRLLSKAEEDFNMCYPLIDPGCPRFVTGTRYAFGDMYENILKRDAELNEWNKSVKTCYREDGSVRFPQQKARDGRTIGFTKEMLERIMRDTPTIFATQYLNQPMLESQQVITKAMLDESTIMPFMAPPLSNAVLFLDLAQTDTDQSDDCVIVCGKQDGKGTMYVVDQRGGVWNPHTFAMNVIDMTLRHRPSKILLEKSGAGIIFKTFLQVCAKERGVYLPIDFMKVDVRPDAKNLRVGALAGHIKGKRFFFFLGLQCWEKASEQALQFPKGKHGHDDWPDTWALMAEQMSQGIMYLPVGGPHITRHSVVAILDRDPITGIQSPEMDVKDGIGDMGGEFSC